MFIPLDAKNTVFLENTLVIYNNEEKETTILKRNGEKITTAFSPTTLKKRYEKFEQDTRINAVPNGRSHQ
ncbi:MAG: hypothetical protein RR272_01155 [Synergistaceae bacterium]